jgi:hypothetical protein
MRKASTLLKVYQIQIKSQLELKRGSGSVWIFFFNFLWYRLTGVKMDSTKKNDIEDQLTLEYHGVPVDAYSAEFGQLFRSKAATCSD